MVTEMGLKTGGSGARDGGNGVKMGRNGVKELYGLLGLR